MIFFNTVSAASAISLQGRKKKKRNMQQDTKNALMEQDMVHCLSIKKDFVMASESHVCVPVRDSGGLHDEHDHYANARLDLFISIYKRNHNIQVFFSLIAGR